MRADQGLRVEAKVLWMAQAGPVRTENAAPAASAVGHIPNRGASRAQAPRRPAPRC